MKNRVEDALSEICIEYGFCIQNCYWEAISRAKFLSAQKFVNLVFKADKTGERDRLAYEEILKDIFIKHVGYNAKFWCRKFLLERKPRLNKVRNKLVVLDLHRFERMCERVVYDYKPSFYLGNQKLKT